MPAGSIGRKLGFKVFLASWPVLAAILAWPGGIRGILLFGLSLSGAAAAGAAAWLVSRLLVERPLAVLVRSCSVSGGSGADPAVRTPDELGELAGAIARMRSALSESLEESREANDRLAGVLETMVEQVVAADSSGNILYLNPAAEALFGVKMEGSAGLPFNSVIRQVGITDLFFRALRSGGALTESVRIHVPEERSFEARVSPFRGGTGAVLVLHDLSRIERLEKVRREFVANVSHELRTPLTSIRGFAETLLAGALSDAANNREFVETIRDQADGLAALVDGILDLSAVESGRTPVAPEDIRLKELAAEVLSRLGPSAEARSVSLSNLVPGSFPPVRSDPSQLRRVLANLVENAVKFNRKGGAVSVEAASSPEGPVVTVRDTGIGIEETDIPRIFERFYRVDRDRSRGTGGAGLGLAIVKHLVENLGGSIDVRSRPGEGSAFTVRLPPSDSPSKIVK
ncbi:MAG: hypothetical protein A2636_06325 [Elusimicrobia bacterium RIFCSPHIGHO2_01_FULL_64_10]|nr:MAG: hypothetical protein A2636_06325 [Elusimicrobia bacterium RIFCSPHIGHO2_01_FULL_64_10]